MHYKSHEPRGNWWTLARCSSPGIVNDSFLSSRATFSSAPALDDDVIRPTSGAAALLFPFLPAARSRGSDDLKRNISGKLV